MKIILRMVKKELIPFLGSDPIAILVYSKKYFAAQFMKKDRSLESITQATSAGQNNTAAIGGYDAYFGTYKVNEETGDVTHTLIASLSPSNIGMTTVRTLRVLNNQLMLQLKTTTPEGEDIVRTLIWKRIN